MKAILKKGLICPQEPVPEDWPEGAALEVRKLDRPRQPLGRADEWMDAVEAAAAKGDPENDPGLDAAIQEVRRRNKQLARKRRGIAE
jgi:hypothetical protein